MWFLVPGEDSSTGNVMGGRKLARYVLEAGAFRAFPRPSDRARGRRDHLEAAQGNSGEHLRLRRHSSHRCCPKSLPSRLEHIEGTEHGGRLYRQERSRSKRPLASTTIASPSCRQVGDGFDHLGKTRQNFLQRAMACEVASGKALDEGIKEIYLDLAAQWRDLAHQNALRSTSRGGRQRR